MVVAKKEQSAVQKKSFSEYIRQPKIMERFNKILGKNAESHIAAAIQLYNSDENLRECEPVTIVTAVLQAASLRLPLQKNFGYAYIIPRIVSAKINGTWTKRKVATFQPGYRGLIQLVMRSGEVKNLHAGKVFEGQITGVNCLTGALETGEKISDKIVGYVATIELLNGFSKTIYMTVDEVKAHAKEYSDGYKYDLKSGKGTSTWTKFFDEMACKTVLTKLLKTYAPISVEPMSLAFREAINAEQVEVTKNGYIYRDNGNGYGTRNEINIPPEVEMIGAPSEIDVPFETEEKTEFVNNETGEVLFEETAEKTPENVEAPF